MAPLGSLARPERTPVRIFAGTLVLDFMSTSSQRRPALSTGSKFGDEPNSRSWLESSDSALLNVEECDDGNLANNDGCNSSCMCEGGCGFELIVNDSTGSDDFASDALLTFFNQIQNPQATDYIFLSLFGNVQTPGAWCATRG